MQGAPRRSARSFFVLPLMLALLASVAFPVFAYAANGEIPQYEVEGTESLPNQTGTSKPKRPNPLDESTGKKATGSGAETGTGEDTGSTSSEAEESKSGGVPATGGGEGGNKPGGGESQKSGNGGEAGKAQEGAPGSIGESEAVSGTQKGTPAAESSGGSSPVVPILIAVAVLAAISIGVVLYRQRKSGQGPDGRGRVSSPNAG